MEWYMTIIKERYKQFTGRAGRSEFWTFAIVNFLIVAALGVVGTVFSFIGLGFIGTITSLLSFVYSIAVLLPLAAVGVRRLQDTDKSGWLMLLGLIPFIGWIGLGYLLAQPSNPDTNQFGPNPEIAHFLD